MLELVGVVLEDPELRPAASTSLGAPCTVSWGPRVAGPASRYSSRYSSREFEACRVF